MKPQDAVHWCKQHDVQITFTSNAGQTGFRLFTPAGQTVEANRLGAAVEKLRSSQAAAASTNTDSRETPLKDLQFNARNCRSRLLRVANVLHVKTIDELLDWAQKQPQGLAAITSFHNIGRRSLEVLVEALEQHGVKQIPLPASFAAA